MRLLERRHYRETLLGWQQGAAAGHGRLVLLAGEAGVGKTAFVGSVCAALEGRARILRGACDPLSTPRPLEPLFDIAATTGGDLARLLGEPEGRAQAFRVFLKLLEARTTIVVFEDVHWADEATLDLLRFLGRRIGSTRALLIATYRDDEVGAAHPLRAVIGDLATTPAVARLALPPLSQGAVAVLADGTGIDASELHQRTGGNPFFVTEVLAAGVGGVPATVRDAVLARASRLSPEARDVLSAAAVIGARVEPWLLEAVLGSSSEALEPCLASGILQNQGGHYAFRHELAREAIYDELTLKRRSELHARTLRALQPLPEPDLARLAHHAEAASDAEAVLRYAPEAARKAAALNAHREAAAQYRRALYFADALPPRERAELLEAYADMSGRIDNGDEAIRARTAATKIWRELGDKLKEGNSLQRLAGSFIGAGRDPEGEAASLEGLRVLETLGPSATLARAYINRGWLRMLSRDNAEAIAWHGKVMALAETLDEAALDPVFHISAHNLLGAAKLMSGDNGAGVANLLKSAEIARDVGLENQVINTYMILGTGCGELYAFTQAERYLEEAAIMALARDLDHYSIYSAAWLALVYLHQGRWAEASERAHLVTERPQAATMSRIMALVALGRLRARRGDPEVWSALDEALALAAETRTLQRIAPVRAARAEAAWLAGDVARAHEEARAAYGLALEKRHPWFVGELAYWRWKAGELASAPKEAARPFALQIRGDWQEAAAEWERLGCPYEAARALAESEDEAALREALAAFEALGARPTASAVARRLRELGATGVPRGPRPKTRANPAQLTSREVEVACLVAEGLRNADIASRLHLSEKTVGHHVSAVLGKLGARSRTEAARKAAQLGILQPREPEAPS